MRLSGNWRWFLFCLLMATVAIVALWKMHPTSAHHFYRLIRYGSREYGNETDVHFTEYLEITKMSIISRLQELNKNDAPYLIYDCMKKTGLCGGWNDRITGVINTLMMSLVINKKFRLIMNTPCDVNDYFAPNKFNWTVTSDIMSNKKRSKTNFLDEDIAKLDLKNISRHFRASVNFFRNNWDAIDLFRVTANIKDKIPWICNIHHADIYKMIFEILFKPTKSVLGPISGLPLDKSKKLVCAHVRMGTNPLDKNHTFAGGQRFHFNRTEMLFEFLEKYDTNSTYMYIASDSPMLKDKIRQTFPDRFVDIPGKIMLVDIDRGAGACEAYGKGFTEWWILTMCDVLVLTRSGFGMMAAYLRDNDKSLYCMNTENMTIVPCTRYDVLEHYPREMHYQLYFPISKRNNVTHDYCPAKLSLNNKLPKYMKKLLGLIK